MESGQAVYILSRLILGALASFLAIMLWTRTRDSAWIFAIIGTIITYAGTVYSVLNLLGIGGGSILSGDSVFNLTILLECLPTVFFAGAFAVMVIRKYRHH